MKNVALLPLVALGLYAAAAVADDPAPRIELLADTVVDSAAWNFPDGKYGTTVNGQTFQQEAVITHAGHQYAAFFADGGVLAVGRRALPGGAWQVIRFADYTARDHRDAHNVVSMGLCAGDGTIHLAFDHHNDPLHYRRSVPGLASRPAEFEWTAEHFGPVTPSLEPRRPIGNVTYPQFFAAPGGKLQLVYRIGSSGDGDWYLAEYAPGADGPGNADGGAWTTLGLLLSRVGRYESSPSRCAYPNPPRYDADDRLHLTWTWRETPAGQPFDLRTNHDLLYAWSDDLGRTWRNNAGQPVANVSGGGDDATGAATSITIDSPGTIARPTRFLWGQMNTTTQFLDARNRPHVINWQQPPDAAESSKDLNTWRYYHYWRAADGTWRENPLPFAGRKPQLVLDDAGIALVVYTRTDNANYHGQDPGGKLTIAAATEASGWADWRTVWTCDRPSVGEPLVDHARWTAEAVLSVYLQDKPAQAGAPSTLRVLDFASPTGPRKS